MKKQVKILTMVTLLILVASLFVGCAASPLDSKINKIENAKSVNGNITITRSGVLDSGTIITILAVTNALAEFAAENKYVYEATGDKLEISGYKVIDPQKDNKVVFKGTIKFKDAK